MLKIKGLSVRLGKFELHSVNFEVEKGEYFVLLGMSGAGKSVLLNVIGGIVMARSGEIILNGRDITREKIHRRKVGLVFQESALFPHMNVFSNIAYPLKSRKYKRSEIKNRVMELAGITSVSHMLDRSPRYLSGGEMQRVALARALALEPECLLLDEPLSSLDVQLRGEMRSLLREINDRGQTIVHVTHDYEEALLLARRIGVIEQGTVVQSGDPADVLQHPRSEFVARFVGIRNFFRGNLTDLGSTLKVFRTTGQEFTVLTDEPQGEGFVIIRAEDIFISYSMPSTSAVNNFKGKIISIEPSAIGSEITADIGVSVVAVLSEQSVAVLKLLPGKNVWLSFKASAVKFIRK